MTISIISTTFWERLWGISICLVLLMVNYAHAQDFSSTNFVVENPVLSSGGTIATSTSFQLTSSIGQLSIGTSTSNTFGINAGFLFFPQVTSGIVTATAGIEQVALSWTASEAFLGWSVD